ncbi:MAG: NuoM family protein [Candidatus Bathyarchaeia archaeon]
MFIVVILMVGHKAGEASGWIALIPAVCMAGFATFLMTTLKEPVVERFPWLREAQPVPLSFGLQVDQLSVSTLFMLSWVAVAGILFSRDYVKRRFDELGITGKRHYSIYYGLYLLYASSLTSAVLSTNLIQFYLFFEVELVASWALVCLYGYGKQERIALLYFIWTHAGAVLLLSGMFMAAHHIGSFEIADLVRLLGLPAASLATLLMALGLLIKMGALGLHAWLPITYVGAPAPVTALIGATSVGIGTYGLARLVLPLHEVIAGPTASLFALWALLTMLYAAITALASRDFKRLVAYLSMSQMNYCSFGLWTLTRTGVAGAISYSISHGFAIALLFLVSGSVYHLTGTNEIKKHGGLAKAIPCSAISFLVGTLTIGGIPPTMGFKSKLLLLAGAWERGYLSGLFEIILAFFGTVIVPILTVGYEFWTLKRVFLGRLPKGYKEKKISKRMITALIIIAIMPVICGIWPRVTADYIDYAVENILAM